MSKKHAGAWRTTTNKKRRRPKKQPPSKKKKHVGLPPTEGRRRVPPSSTKRDPVGKFPVLVSYAYLRQASDEVVAWVLNNPHVEFLIDSGGFTALNAGEEIDLEEYMAWLHRWKHRLFGYVALDKLGDPVTTEANLKIMRESGLTPVPVHVRGDDEKRMDELFEWAPWVALGGFRRPQAGWGPKAYVRQKMIWAKSRNVHWLGYTNQQMILGFQPYSVDSSNLTAGAQWGLACVYAGGLRWIPHGRLHQWVGKPLPPAVLRVLQRTGFGPSDFWNPRLWTQAKLTVEKFLPNEVTVYSWVQYVRDLRRHVGTRYFQAQAPPKMWRLYHWIDESLPEGEEPYVKYIPVGVQGPGVKGRASTGWSEEQLSDWVAGGWKEQEWIRDRDA